MKLQVPYGTETIPVQTDAEVVTLFPAEVEVRDESILIREALENPLGSERFEEFASPEKSLLIVVNDGTRPTPTARIIHALYPVLSVHPQVNFIVATGAHRAPNAEEYRLIFGDHYEEFSDRILIHDARRDEDMVHLGTSSNGTVMDVNRAVTETDTIVVIGSVEPHYFAGYTGGRKSFLPGLASYRTIEMNHKLALSNKARSLALDGNPVHEDMMDALRTLKDMHVFSIQTVLTGDHGICAVCAGDLQDSFYAAVEEAAKVFCAPLEKRGNIVLTVAPYPMDVDLYQSQKAIDNGKLALTNGGVLILVARCADGIGGKTFFDLLSSAGSPQGVLYAINKDYKLGYHKAAKLAQIGVWAKMWAVTEMDGDLLRSVNIEPFTDIQNALDQAEAYIREQGKEPRIVFMPGGSLTVPAVKGTDMTGGWVRIRSDVGIADLHEVLEVVLDA